MSASETQYQPYLDQFLGEDRVTPEHRLAPVLSPDALNMDYLDGLLRPRPGVVRMHRTPLLSGGLKVADATSLPGMGGGGHVVVAAAAVFSFAGDFTYEFMAMPWWESVATGGEKFLLRHGNGSHASAPTEGVHLSLVEVGGAWRWRVYLGDSGGPAYTVTHGGGSGSAPERGKVQAIRISFLVATGSVALSVDGVVQGGTLPNTFVPADSSTGNLILGDAAGALPDLWWVVDEVRVWTGASSAPLTSTRRELLASDDQSALVGYWQFSVGSWTPVGNSRSFPDVSVNSNNATAFPRAIDARGLVHGPGNQGRVTGLAPAAASGLVSAAVVCTPSDLYLLDFASQTVSFLYPAGGSSPRRWSHTHSQDWLILCNGVSENLRYRADAGVLPLSYPDPVGPVSATAGGTGGLSAGLYGYLFAFRDGTHGVESAVGAFTTTVSAGGGDEVTLGATAGQELPATALAGVTDVRIYRTHANGSEYYFLADVPLHQASYVDGTADSALTSPRDPYWGFAPPSRVCFEHNGSVLLCNQAGAESRVLVGEPGRLGAFYSEAYLDAGAGDGDQIVGALSVRGIALIFKRRSVWQITGQGPSTYGAQRLYPDSGCVSGETIAASHQYVYWLSPTGVMRLPLDGGPPLDLSEGAQRPLFAEFLSEDYGSASGIWDDRGKRYLCSFRAGGVVRTLVHYELSGSWALWDLDAGAWRLLAIDGGRVRLYVGWRGVVGVLSGVAEGLQLEGAAAIAPATTSTGGSGSTVVVSGASWPVGGLVDVDVSVVLGDGSRETRRVWWNTADTLHVTPAFSASPVGGESVILGGRALRWRTPYLPFGNPFDDSVLHRFGALVEDAGGSEEAVPMYHASRDGVAVPFAVPTGSRMFEVELSDRGRELCVGVDGYSATAGWALAGLLITHQQREARP